MTARRAEAEVVADTLVQLDYDGQLSHGLTAEDVAPEFDLTSQDMIEARERFRDRGYVGVSPAGRGFQPQKKKKASRQKDRFRVNPKTSAKEAWCSGARVHEPHWAPVKEFGERADRPGELKSACRDALKGYQRQYTVAAQAMGFVNQLGIEVVVDQDSVVVGLKCTTCREPFQVGDTVRMHGAPHHQACLQEALG